jgi:hypothetical protein
MEKLPLYIWFFIAAIILAIPIVVIGVYESGAARPDEQMKSKACAPQVEIPACVCQCLPTIGPVVPKVEQK